MSNNDETPSNSQMYEELDKEIESLKEKMKLLNYNNLQPPYFLHTLSKFRETHFSKFLKKFPFNVEHPEKCKKHLEIVHYLVSKFDDECFDLYSAQLMEPYIRKMFQDNYEFSSIDFKHLNTEYNLNAEIQETLTQTAEWLSQVETTQDLLHRVEFYFGIKVPQIMEKLKQQGIKSEKNTIGQSFVSGVKRLLSFGLRKGSKMVQTTFFTAVAPGALMLTFAIMGGTATLPWKTTLTPSNLVTTAAVVAVPFILDTMALTVEKSDYREALKRWALTFEQLSANIRQFNDLLEEEIRNCATSVTENELNSSFTNLQKLLDILTKNITNATNFDEEKFKEMRERTWAYFREYLEIQNESDEWVLVIPKDQETNYFSDGNSKEDKEMSEITKESSEISKVDQESFQIL